MMERDEEATCRCGYGRDHHMVSAEGEYSLGGWLSHTIGITTTPRRIRYRCRVCREVIEETSDPERLERERHRCT